MPPYLLLSSKRYNAESALDTIKPNILNILSRIAPLKAVFKAGLCFTLAFALSINTALAQFLADENSGFGQNAPLKIMSRGEAVYRIITDFELEQKDAKFLDVCLATPDECFFVFSAMSDYDGIRFEPMILYPDVFPAYKYYDAITTATALGLVHGYIEEDQSPFHPMVTITRIQALKVILAAANLLQWKEKFELEEAMKDAGGPEYILPFEDVDLSDPDNWWYGRYLAFALENGIIMPATSFRPNDGVTEDELNKMISRAIDYAKKWAEEQTGQQAGAAVK